MSLGRLRIIPDLLGPPRQPYRPRFPQLTPVNATSMPYICATPMPQEFVDRALVSNDHSLLSRSRYRDGCWALTSGGIARVVRLTFNPRPPRRHQTLDDRWADRWQPKPTEMRCLEARSRGPGPGAAEGCGGRC